MFEEKEEELFRHIVAALSADMPVIELAEKEDRQQIQASGLTILPQKRQVTINGRDLPLSPLEFSVLRYLSAHPGWIVSQEELYQAVWKEEPVNIKGAVYCTISSLRKKLKAHTRKEYIQTV